MNEESPALVHVEEISPEMKLYYADHRLMWRNLAIIIVLNLGWNACFAASANRSPPPNAFKSNSTLPERGMWSCPESPVLNPPVRPRRTRPHVEPPPLRATPHACRRHAGRKKQKVVLPRWEGWVDFAGAST